MVRKQTVTAQVALAFLAIYFVWGSTYLAIKVAVASVPPLFAAGIRFVIAGGALYLWCMARGEPQPSRLEWRNLSVLGALKFLGAYSGLFWAEKTLPSGVASVLVATIPVWTALLEVFVFKRQQMSWMQMAAILLGLGGVAVLAFDPGSGDVSLLACVAIIAGEITWSLGSVLTTMMTLPESSVVSAGAQMMTGGAMLLLCSGIAGELHPLPHVSTEAALSIAYLIVAGSLIAFTAYEWLLTRMPSTTVTSYAFVNPVVALVIGHFYAGEALGIRGLLGAALVLSSVVAIMKSRK